MDIGKGDGESSEEYVVKKGVRRRWFGSYLECQTQKYVPHKCFFFYVFRGSLEDYILYHVQECMKMDTSMRSLGKIDGKR